MPTTDPGAAKNDAGERRPAFYAPRPRQLIRVVLIAAAFAALSLGVGFLWFVGHLPAGDSTPNRTADGIVVLTGRASRISDAIELLASGRGRRLLISGVYPTTTAAAIARLVPEHQRWVACCVDLDHSAVNTIGNAIQTRHWVIQHGMKSLIVVTSNYHMPRAMTELAHQLPNVALIAYPVVPERVRIESWWSSPATARLLLAEYLKYIRTMIRTKTALVVSRPGGP
jgi:uncharacterized SAM-binding protein YcdF (DUF218 family)